MKKKLSVLTIIVFSMVFFSATTGITAEQVEQSPIDQVKQNVAALVKSARGSQPHVTAVELKKILGNGKEIVLLDVRTLGEYDAGHLPGALHVGRGLIEWIFPKKVTDINAKIYVYCKTGGRSSLVTKRLMEMGYTDVTNVSDSFKGWVIAGYSVYNKHGEFKLVPEGFQKAEPMMDD